MSIIQQHYRVLGLNSRQCDLNDVKKAFKSKALQLHPDRNPNKSDDAFKRVHAAYEAILAYHHHHHSHRQAKQSNLGKSTYSGVSTTGNCFTHHANNNKHSSIFTNYARPSQQTTTSSTSPPLFTQEELFGSHTIPGGWVFRDGATHKSRFTKNSSNNTTITGDNAAKGQKTANATTPCSNKKSSRSNLPQLSSSQSSMKTAYEAAEQHWRQAHGPRVPVSGYKSPFHIPSDFAQSSNNNGNTTNLDKNRQNISNGSKNNPSDVQDVKAKYKQYREEQQQNLHLLAKQHAQLHNGKLTAFQFSKYSTAQEKKAALHERWSSLQKNISNKINVADDLVGGVHHENIKHNNVHNNNESSKHYYSSISPDEAALLMAEVAAMSKKKKALDKKNSNFRRQQQQTRQKQCEQQHRARKNEQQNQLSQKQQQYKSHEELQMQDGEHCNNTEKVENSKQSKNKDDNNAAQYIITNNDNNKDESNKMDNTNTSFLCHETQSPKTASKQQVKINIRNAQGKQQKKAGEHKKTSEAHRDGLSHQRRELMYQLFYAQYAPDPALVSQMSDAELYSLLQLFHNLSDKLQKVLNARLTSSHCSRCGAYGILQQSTQTVKQQNTHTTIESSKQETNFVHVNSESKNDHEQKSSKGNCEVNQVEKGSSVSKTKVKAFSCAHVCVCEECAKWVTQCPLCGAPVKHYQ